MSSGLRVQLRDLLHRVEKVAEELTDIAEGLAELQEEGAFGDWVLVEEPRQPLAIADLKPIWDDLSFTGLEDGPPELPTVLRRLALERIEGVPEQVVERAREAFNAGFWCYFAIATRTPYRRIEERVTEDRTHWIILYRHFPQCNRRVSDITSFQTALESEADPVWEGFQTLAELIIFCVGARIRLPSHEKWISLC